MSTETDEAVLDSPVSDAPPVEGVQPLEDPTEQPAVEPQPEEEVPGLRDVATELGYDVSSFEDDATALNHLVGLARQAEAQQQQLAQYQQLMAAQQQVQQPEKKEEPEQSWSPPEFNPMWLTQVQRDAEGNLVPASGGSPETVQKVLAWAQYRQEQQDKFWNNPFEYLRPEIERIAREQVQNDLRSNQDTQTAQQLIEKNAEWIYQDPQNQQQFTPEGQLFVDAAQKLPNASIQEQFDYAMSQVERARLQRQLDELKSQQTAAEAHQQKKQAALGGNVPNVSGSLQDGEQNPDLSLTERMMAAMTKAGINAVDLEGPS